MCTMSSPPFEDPPCVGVALATAGFAGSVIAISLYWDVVQGAPPSEPASKGEADLAAKDQEKQWRMQSAV